METRTTLPFADGDYEFWLPMTPSVIPFERESGGESIFTLFYNIGENAGTVAGEMVLTGPAPVSMDHIHSLIRNALIGGGTPSAEAKALVKVYCFPARPAILDMALAYNVLKAAIYGIELPENGKKNSEATADLARS